ncbi:helix-turn-helix domain-containing protein [Pseudomonas citronellolis]|uniref:helix-turn-helix domain-containing protein n=1 Tax=Pseudomonas citronellolis TaxID=53408 RepID=UPI0021BED768|nr:helix-turn-helix domain-containing protein [Pseudomonas citronellolis]UXJ55057.1 helix-turn-helix domain-containing protein [Pseudomonas citronellolis]
MKSCNALIAPPGAGKSQWLINHISQHRNENSLLAFPTLLLSEEITKRLTELDIPFNIINSDTIEGGTVTQVLEEALCNQNDNVIICTHTALLLIRPDLLCGWKLYIDEVPSAWDCASPSFQEIQFQKVFDPSIITLEPVEGKKHKVMKARPDKLALIETLSKGGEGIAHSDTATLVFKKLLDSRYALEVDELDQNICRTVRIIGVHDYLSVFEAADEVTILCAELDKTLLGVSLRGAGWKTNPIDYDLKFSGYSNPVTIKPFLSGRNYSRSVALEKAGKPQPEYTEGCNIDKWLKKVFKDIGHHKALMTAHKWLQVELPLDSKGESKILSIKIDNRGINDYSSYTYAICLQHGNISPVDARSLSTLAHLLSVENLVTEQDIKNSVQYERLYESTLQTVCRTALRDRSNHNPVTLYVQDESVAQFLADKFDKAVIDYSLAKNPARVETEAKISRNAKKAEVVKLFEQGYTNKEISTKLSINLRTVQRWLKDFRQLVIAA